MAAYILKSNPLRTNLSIGDLFYLDKYNSAGAFQTMRHYPISWSSLSIAPSTKYHFSGMFYKLFKHGCHCQCHVLLPGNLEEFSRLQLCTFPLFSTVKMFLWLWVTMLYHWTKNCQVHFIRSFIADQKRTIQT